MLNEAIRRHTNDRRLSSDELIIKPEGLIVRPYLLDILHEMPYLHWIFLPTFQTCFRLTEPNTREQVHSPRAKSSKICYRNVSQEGLVYQALHIGAKQKRLFAQCFCHVPTSYYNSPA